MRESVYKVKAASGLRLLICHFTKIALFMHFKSSSVEKKYLSDPATGKTFDVAR